MSRLSERISLLCNLSPHKTIGGTNEGDVAGIGMMFGLTYKNLETAFIKVRYLYLAQIQY